MSDSESAKECPLCLEPLEIDDLSFYPCHCGYQICRFCWHRIKNEEPALCPACRQPYPDNPVQFKPLTEDDLQSMKLKKKEKELQRRKKITDNRKHLGQIRVLQKNLVFVVGLPLTLDDPEKLKSAEYFGQYGKVLKVVANANTAYAGAQAPTLTAYVTYARMEEALQAVEAVNNVQIDGRTLKASLGTTKYCSTYLKNQQCHKVDCMYLHELADKEASFTKDDMHAGKHQEYERKLVNEMKAKRHEDAHHHASDTSKNDLKLETRCSSAPTVKTSTSQNHKKKDTDQESDTSEQAWSGGGGGGTHNNSEGEEDPIRDPFDDCDHNSSQELTVDDISASQESSEVHPQSTQTSCYNAAQITSSSSSSSALLAANSEESTTSLPPPPPPQLGNKLPFPNELSKENLCHDVLGYTPSSVISDESNLLPQNYVLDPHSERQKKEIQKVIGPIGPEGFTREPPRTDRQTETNFNSLHQGADLLESKVATHEVSSMKFSSENLKNTLPPFGSSTTSCIQNLFGKESEPSRSCNYPFYEVTSNSNSLFSNCSRLPRTLDSTSHPSTIGPIVRPAQSSSVAPSNTLNTTDDDTIITKNSLWNSPIAPRQSTNNYLDNIRNNTTSHYNGWPTSPTTNFPRSPTKPTASNFFPLQHQLTNTNINNLLSSNHHPTPFVASLHTLRNTTPSSSGLLQPVGTPLITTDTTASSNIIKSDDDLDFDVFTEGNKEFADVIDNSKEDRRHSVSQSSIFGMGMLDQHQLLRNDMNRGDSKYFYEKNDRFAPSTSSTVGSSSHPLIQSTQAGSSSSLFDHNTSYHQQHQRSNQQQQIQSAFSQHNATKEAFNNLFYQQTSNNHTIEQQQQINFDLSDQRNHFKRMLPPHVNVKFAKTASPNDGILTQNPSDSINHHQTADKSRFVSFMSQQTTNNKALDQQMFDKTYNNNQQQQQQQQQFHNMWSNNRHNTSTNPLQLQMSNMSLNSQQNHEHNNSFGPFATKSSRDLPSPFGPPPGLAPNSTSTSPYDPAILAASGPQSMYNQIMEDTPRWMNSLLDDDGPSSTLCRTPDLSAATANMLSNNMNSSNNNNLLHRQQQNFTDSWQQHKLQDPFQLNTNNSNNSGIPPPGFR